VFQEDEFSTATLLRLSPYSPMFNPIENLWSQIKSRVKSMLREGFAAFMGRPPLETNISLEEYRLSYLENIAERVLNG